MNTLQIRNHSKSEPRNGVDELGRSSSNFRWQHHFHGTSAVSAKPSSSASNQHHQCHTLLPPIRAMRSLQGRVICTANDKTVNVEVTRLAPHPKYKRRVRKKKKFQAHDPENQFQFGDVVQLEKCKPISKKKTFVAIPVPKRKASKQPKEVAPEDIGIPLESDSSGGGSRWRLRGGSGGGARWCAKNNRRRWFPVMVATEIRVSCGCNHGEGER